MMHETCASKCCNPPGTTRQHQTSSRFHIAAKEVNQARGNYNYVSQTGVYVHHGGTSSLSFTLGQPGLIDISIILYYTY